MTRILGHSIQRNVDSGYRISAGLRLPVLKRGKLRTLALKRAQVVTWDDPRANVYGCYPCPRCGEMDARASQRDRNGYAIKCYACGDERQVRWVVNSGLGLGNGFLRPW